MDVRSVSIGLAWLAGVASFLSPCVFALVPAYVGYLGGIASHSGAGAAPGRWRVFSHGVAFVIGFSLVFIGLGAAASAVGQMLFDMRGWLGRIGGVIVIIFGLHTMGIINLPFLNADTRRQAAPDPSWGYISSGLMGVFFSAGWAPCVGPVLGAVLTLALDSGSLGRGVLLLVAYSAGMAVPFLLAALGIGRVSEWLRRYSRYLRYVSLATGALLVIIGVMLLLGVFQRLAAFGFFIDTGL
ncbi:MAG: cytochrome c biogenesis protein CcdA [Chloroflexi bacterium]|nr:cytochrome c biogenesis protein CcdA [Chloroflexota bacterium]